MKVTDMNKKKLKRKNRDVAEDVLSDDEKGKAKSERTKDDSEPDVGEPAEKKARQASRAIPPKTVITVASGDNPFDPADAPDPERVRYLQPVGTANHQTIKFFYEGSGEVYKKLWWDTIEPKRIQFAPDTFRDKNGNTDYYNAPQRRSGPTWTLPLPMHTELDYDAKLWDALSALDKSHIDYLASEDAKPVWKNIGIPQPDRDRIEMLYVSPLKSLEGKGASPAQRDLRARFANKLNGDADYKLFRSKEDGKPFKEAEPHEILPGEMAQTTFVTDTIYVRPVDEKKAKRMAKSRNRRPTGPFTCGAEANVRVMKVTPDTTSQIKEID